MAVTQVTSTGTGTINPINLSPTLFTSYSLTDNEPYESMLIRLTDPNGIFVVEQNADGGNNFAEYRVGTDVFTPSEGSRVLTGRVTGTAFSSLNVSYINDLQWTTTDGIMNVPGIVVNAGDQFSSIDGIMAYTFGNMKLLPRNNNDFIGGINIDDASNHSITAYPNPVSGELRVDYTFGTTQIGAEAQVIDLMGRTLKTVEMSDLAGIETIATDNLTTGTYMLRIVSDNGGVLRTIKFNKIR